MSSKVTDDPAMLRECKRKIQLRLLRQMELASAAGRTTLNARERKLEGELRQIDARIRHADAEAARARRISDRVRNLRGTSGRAVNTAGQPAKAEWERRKQRHRDRTARVR